MSISQIQTSNSIAIFPVTCEAWENLRGSLPVAGQQWAKLNGFKGEAGQVCLLPDDEGGISQVLAGYDDAEEVRWTLAGLPEKLPEGNYHLSCAWDEATRTQVAIGWGLGCYRFRRFHETPDKPLPCLFSGGNVQEAEAFIQAITLVRDLVNLPANHMMPEDLSAVMRALADTYMGSFTEVVGDALLAQGYPAVHAVGRASRHVPRLLELEWGHAGNPELTLVGKGVCFDTGGLDLKPSQYMRLMQKDMGGAAHVLGLAQLIMQNALPVRLRVLVPAVENAVGGDAFRPGDILATRSGKQIEVDNTDAEGRLVLCDALTAAAEHKPNLIIDFATLTGAARVALGTEIPVFFSNDRTLIQALQFAAETDGELIWNLPLHKPYFTQLKSNFAHMLNSGGSYGGAITAALFLNEFVPAGLRWVHFDVMAWNNRARPGRPVGGEGMGLFAVYQYLKETYQELPKQEN